MKNKWEDVYKKEYGSVWYPMDGIIRFASRYLKRRIGIDRYETKAEKKRVLDLGCGNGNHLIFFAGQGYDVSGLDISSEAIEIARAWLDKNSLKADLKVGDIEKLPYPDDTFDVVISHGVFDHIPSSKAKKAIEEVHRVCKSGAYICITFRSTDDCEFGRGEEVDKNTYILSEGYEKGIVQHFYNIEDINDLLKKFKIFDIEEYEEKFPKKFSIDKAYLQSSKGQRTFINLSEKPDMIKYSRWYVAGEK